MATSPLIPSNAFKDNLSSYQIANVLDELLILAVEPLVQHSNIVQHWLAEMLPLIVSDGRRRVSTIPQAELIPLVFTAIMTTDPDKQLALVRQMKLERNQIFFLVTQVQELCSTYLDDMLVVAQTRSKTKKNLHQARLLGVEDLLQANRKHWHQALLSATYWIDLAYQFKQMVAGKYYKYAFKKAMEAEYSTGLTISIADLYNNYILAIYRAIDKYDSSRGMLSSYIGMWFKNASSNPDFDHEVNTAFSIPASQRRIFQKQNWTNRKGTAIMNIANPIDDQVLDEQENIPVDTELVGQLGQFGRKLRLDTLMLVTGIPYPLSAAECKAIERARRFEQSINLEIKG